MDCDLWDLRDLQDEKLRLKFDIAGDKADCDLWDLWDLQDEELRLKFDIAGDEVVAVLGDAAPRRVGIVVPSHDPPLGGGF